MVVCLNSQHIWLLGEFLLDLFDGAAGVKLPYEILSHHLGAAVLPVLGLTQGRHFL